MDRLVFACDPSDVYQISFTGHMHAAEEVYGTTSTKAKTPYATRLVVH